MPTLSSHQSSHITKMLLIGDSGAGKSGSLASLVSAGYNLKIVDFDNGLDILASVLKSKNDPTLLDRVEYETHTDRIRNVVGKPIPLDAAAWPDGLKHLDSIEKAGLSAKDVVVLDSLTFAAQAAMRYVLKLNGRLAAPAQIQDWGAAMNMTENLVALLTADEFPANVVCTAHIKYIGNEEAQEPVRGYPAVLGKELAPKIGRYFNSCLLVRSEPRGNTTARTIFTNTQGIIELKNSNPFKVKPTYPIESGLADFFAAVRGDA